MITESALHARLVQRLYSATLRFLAVNLLLGLAYRCLFVLQFVPRVTPAEVGRILLYGTRLDVALLAIELDLLLPGFLLLRYLRYRPLVAMYGVLTLLNASLLAANLVFFRERGEHLWEMLLAQVTRPLEILIAVLPFLQVHPLASSLTLLAVIVLIRSGRAHLKQLPTPKVDLWHPARHLGIALIAVLVLLLGTLDVVSSKHKGIWRFDWIPKPAASQYYMQFDSYPANQAVASPLHDFFRFYLPATLTGISNHYLQNLSPAAALETSCRLLGLPPAPRDYPLERRLEAGPELGLRNVVILQIEGLSGALINRRESEREITPFLNRLARDGLYFSKVLQSFNATDGGVMATVTSSHKEFNRSWRYLQASEISGYFSTLPHLLGQRDYRHLGIFGFESRREDFAAFLRNQGFDVVDSPILTPLIEARHPGAEMRNSLGLFDGLLLEEAAGLLTRQDGPFTAHLITASTHSPWAIPAAAPHPFNNERLDSFHYLDASLAAFFRNMQRNPAQFAQTLFVIVADHTSILTESGALDRMRIPVIFYATALHDFPGKAAINTAVLGSQVDIQPTVLQLLDGDFRYAGMGTSLIDAHSPRPGVISSSRYESYYVKDGLALRFAPYADDTDALELLRVDGARLSGDIRTADERGRLASMQREYFALYKTAGWLARNRQILPLAP